MKRSFLIPGLILLMALPSAAQEIPVRFQHLTINDGLPENSVRSILQDHLGFLWFGTQNGVARYDGTHMDIFLPDPDDPHSLDRRFVLAMDEDPDGRIWMGSYAGGVSVFDPSTEQFRNFDAEGDSLPGPGISTIRALDDGVWFSTGGQDLYRYVDDRFERVVVPPFQHAGTQGLTGLEISDREIWVGSAQSGVAILDRASGSWTHLRHDPADPESLPNDFITFIQRDSQGRVWVGSRNGLALHKGGGRFATFRPRPADGPSEPNYMVCVTEDAAGHFWVGAAIGLYRFEPDSGRFTQFTHDPEQPESPVRGPVLSILCDRSGIIWAGSWHTGLNKYDPGSAKFEVYLHDPGRPGSLDDDAIGSVYEARDGTLWVGTGSRSPGGTQGGLNWRAPGTTEFSHLPLPSAQGRQVRTISILLEDPRGALWVGTNGGLWQVDAQRTALIRPAGFADVPTGLRDGMIMDLVVDHGGRIWVASWMGGLHRYDPLTGGWRSYYPDPADDLSLASGDLSTLGVDEAGRLWVGTDSGFLQIYDPDDDAFASMVPLAGTLESVFHLTPSRGGLMLVCSGAGIHLSGPEQVHRSYTTRDGLPSDYAGRAIQDQQQNIWASTGLGLVRIDFETGDVSVFDQRDGLPRNEIHFAVCRTAEGRLFFGGHHGLVSFQPEAIRASAYVPPVYLTDVRINDQSLRVGADSPLTQALVTTERLELGPDQNDISLTFAALDFAHPERNRYRFRLDPLDEDWRQPTDMNSAHYTNLNPGTFVFSVQGTNRDGVWNETPTVLTIRIAPPWYRTVWAQILYAVIIVLVVVTIYRQLILRERMRLALEMERAEASHLQSLDHLKSRFFANISHEFRTPLTLLMSPLQRLQEDPTSGSPELFTTMARNARRLGRLIDQLLDLSRLEADRMPSQWKQGDWCQYLRALVSSFETLAEQRGIVLTANWPRQPGPAWHDTDLLDKVLVNLLSNALKFTPGGGEVTLTVEVNGAPRPHPWPGQGEETKTSGEARLLSLTVLNTGSHINPEDLDSVFDRFHQTLETTDYGDLGSGIGLALVKELTDWCGGDISVASDPQLGTSFTVVLPLFTTTPPDHQVKERFTPAVDLADQDPLDEAREEIEDPDELTESGLPAVLLVEDNADLRTYVRDELGDEFQVLVAANGNAGLDLARTEIPDLILSDVMMPGLNGLDLCEKLKADDLTNHIPVILLTAKAGPRSRKEGLQSGADDYVAKPFDVEELRIRIRNLLEQRQLLAERYAQLEVARPGRAANPVLSADDRFLQKTREIIAEHLEDPDFRVEGLCKEVGMSRTQLHRKFKAVAGRSAGEFIRVERLNRAAEMLGDGESNVTEVAYSVGYRSLSQFAKAFREQFGMAPSDFEA